MKLLFDVGNTRLKWAWQDSGRLIAGGSLSHRGQEDWVLPPLASRASSAYAVSVAGDGVNTRLADAVASRFGLKLRFVAATAEAAGVRSAYAAPQRLGADRWAALAAAHYRGGHACIMDCGSAVTVDAVSDDGDHLGGLILPGLAMMRRSLNQDTAGLPQVEHGDVRLFAADTDTAIRSGTLLGLAAMMDGLARQVRERLGGRVHLYVTGGDAPVLVEYMREPALLVPDLVLEGLAVLVEELT